MDQLRSATKVPPSRIRVAAVQMVFTDSLAGNLAKIRKAAARAAAAGADAALFPECATTGYACDFGSVDAVSLRRTLHEVSRLAADLGVRILLGSPIYAGRSLHNAFLVFDAQGRLAHVYAKCQLTAGDRHWFKPGNSLSLFDLKGVLATAIICHERRYPELVRLPVMAGGQVIFHPNAGLDNRAVSRAKHRGRDGIPVRAFENAAFYVFANSVGPQGGGKWSAGDSKIIAPDGSTLALADNRHETVLVADLDLALASRKYALESLQHPRFLARHWRAVLGELRRRVRETDDRFRRWFGAPD